MIATASLTTRSQLETRYFGDFRITDPGSGEAIAFKARKSLAVFAYLLASDGRPISRERLAALLWSARREEQARASLRQTLAELRASPAGCALTIGRTTVSLVPGIVTTDLEAIDRAARQNDLATLAEATASLDPHLLDGLDGIDAPFDEWLASERARILSQVVNRVVVTLETVPRDAMMAHRRQILESLLRIDPADERLVRIGMEHDQQEGDHAALHRRYRTFEALLARDYDAAASSQTQDLFRRLTKIAPVTHGSQIAPTVIPSVDAIIQRRLEPPVVVIQPVVADSEDAILAAQFCRGELEVALAGIAEIRLLSLDDLDPEALRSVVGRSVASYTLRGWLSTGDGVMRLKWLLSRTRDGILVWSRAFDVDRGQIGSAIAELVAQVAGAVLPAVERDLAAIMPSRQCDAASSAFELYFEGRTLMLTDGDLAQKRQAAMLFERAIASDPKLVNAYLDLARLYNTDFCERMLGHDVTPMRRRAFDLCAHAVTIDPASARVRARMGWCYLRRGDAAQARHWFEEALVRSPYHADCLNEVGCGLLHIGDLDRAKELIARGFAINPYPLSDYFADTGILMLLTGDHACGEEYFEIAGSVVPRYRLLRMANLALLRGPRPLDADALRRDLHALWHVDAVPTDTELLEAVSACSPLLRGEHRAVVARGMSVAGWHLPDVSSRRDA